MTDSWAHWVTEGVKEHWGTLFLTCFLLIITFQVSKLITSQQLPPCAHLLYSLQAFLLAGKVGDLLPLKLILYENIFPWSCNQLLIVFGLELLTNYRDLWKHTRHGLGFDVNLALTAAYCHPPNLSPFPFLLFLFLFSVCPSGSVSSGGGGFSDEEA